VFFFFPTMFESIWFWIGLILIALVIGIRRAGFQQPKMWKDIQGIDGIPILGVAYILQKDPFGFLATCKQKFGGLFWLNLAGNRVFVEGDREITKLVMKSPLEIAESGPGVIKAFGLDLFVKPWKTYTPIELIRDNMTSKLPKLFHPLYAMTKNNVDLLLGQKKTFKNLMAEFSYGLICKIGTRSILGPEFDNSHALHKIFVDYNQTAENLMGVALLVPKMFHRFFTAGAQKQDELVWSFILPVIHERRKSPPEDSLDLLQSMIDCGMDDENILNSVKAIMWAAVMNTASAISHLLYDVFANPKIAKKLLQEQEDIRKNGITHDSLGQMVYLDACIRETLRMASPPFGAARMVYQDIESKQGTIPKDNIILISRHLMHYDETLWKDPNVYDPSRFLETSIKNWAWIPYGGGRHICPGRFYAVFVIKMLVAEIVSKYDIHVAKRPPYVTRGNEVRSAEEPITFTRKSHL